MKLKLARNSLFAMLLRSPWWLSLALAVALAALLRALLPPEYALPAMLSSLPFVVVAAVAAWKQWRAPSPAQVSKAMQRLQAMNAREFAGAIEAAFRAQGHDVRRLDGPGADLELSKGARRTVVAYRRWKAARLGVEPLRELQTAQRRLAADACLIVSTGEPSEQAADFLRASNAQLIDSHELARLMK